MQGHFNKPETTYSIETHCAHCGEPLHIDFDAGLGYKIAESQADPLVFVPMVDIHKLKDPSIIDAF